MPAQTRSFVQSKILGGCIDCWYNVDGCWSSPLFLLALKSWVSTTANKRNETITKIKMMSGCLPPHISGCLPPQNEEYDDAGDDDDDGVMNSSHEVIILRHHHLLPAWSSSFPCGGSRSVGPVEDPEASQMLHNADCTANTSYIWWNHKDWHVSHSNYST